MGRRPRCPPVDPAFFRRWFDDARRWGVYRDRAGLDADVLVRCPRAARRRRAGRRRGSGRSTRSAASTASTSSGAWRRPPTRAGGRRLDHVVAVRTSDDYRFAADPAILWTWYLTVNRLAAALGLRVFKDCFFSARPPEGGGDAIDGDPHAESRGVARLHVGGSGRHRRPHRSHRPRDRAADVRRRRADPPRGRPAGARRRLPVRRARPRRAAGVGDDVGDEAGSDVDVRGGAQHGGRPHTIRDRLDLTEVGLDRPRGVYDWRRGTSSGCSRRRSRPNSARVTGRCGCAARWATGVTSATPRST